MDKKHVVKILTSVVLSVTGIATQAAEDHNPKQTAIFGGG